MRVTKRPVVTRPDSRHDSIPIPMKAAQRKQSEIIPKPIKREKEFLQMKQQQVNKVVLAYSGGLDTSVIVPRLRGKTMAVKSSVFVPTSDKVIFELEGLVPEKQSPVNCQQSLYRRFAPLEFPPRISLSHAAIWRGV